MSQAALFTQTLDFAATQCRQVLAKYPGYHPMYTVAGNWNQEGERWTHWCEGFYPGIYWLLHEYTGNPFWRQHAETASKRLEPRRWDRNVHDLGFLFFSTYLRWYRLTGDEALKQVLIDAGRTLAMRRQIGGYLCSFIGPESLFIDIMMNVGIIFWAARETGDETLRQIAIEHCRTTQKYLVRNLHGKKLGYPAHYGGGTAHEGIFDVKTGVFLHQATHQGHAPDSTWTRGLAWAIYGFTAAHRLSGLREFLDTAQKCADCYLLRSPANLVPPWDFDAPDDGKQPWDSSAAAITASGLFDLAEQVPDVLAKERFRISALRFIESHCSVQFIASKTPGWEGIFLHGVYHFHKNLGVDESVAWGDHFLSRRW